MAASEGGGAADAAVSDAFGTSPASRASCICSTRAACLSSSN